MGRVEAAQANYVDMVPPANIQINPPVIGPRQGLPVSAEGAALAALLDGMDVENHWLAGQPVDWKTGNPVDGDGTINNGGAFVAAVGARVKVPMPPPVLENFAAGEQYDWLLDQGPGKGWVLVGEMEAQLLANQGWLVIAAWKDPAPAGERVASGQTAIVRPDGRPAAEIRTRGPRLVLAGPRNHNNIALKDGFRPRPGRTWSLSPNGRVRGEATPTAKTNSRYEIANALLDLPPGSVVHGDQPRWEPGRMRPAQAKDDVKPTVKGEISPPPADINDQHGSRRSCTLYLPGRPDHQIDRPSQYSGTRFYAKDCTGPATR